MKHLQMVAVAALCLAEGLSAEFFPGGAAHGESTESELKQLEARRCEAINTLDLKELNDVLADDYVHVHSVGIVNDKAQFIAGIQDRRRRVERGPLTIKVYGDTAIITGEQRNLPLDEPLSSAPLPGPAAGAGNNKFFAMEVAHRLHGKWRFVSMHVTPLSGKAGPESAAGHR